MIWQRESRKRKRLLSKIAPPVSDETGGFPQEVLMREQIERIENMEERMDRAWKAVLDLHTAIDQFDAVKEDIEVLSDYYENGCWRQDYEADEAGALPRDLKRGVLSQDALYDLLTEYEELKKQLNTTN